MQTSKLKTSLVGVAAYLGLSCFASQDAQALTTNIAKGKCDKALSVAYVNPENAFDGDSKTSSTSVTAGNQYAIAAMGALTVDLGSSKPLLKIVINYDVTGTPLQYYKVQGSNDGKNWTDILRVWSPTFPTDEHMLSAVTYQYVRIDLPPFPPLAGGDVPWLNTTINEIEIYERGAGDPAGDPVINYPQPFDRSTWSSKVNGNDYPQAINKVDQGWMDPHGIGFVLGSKPEAIHTNMNAGDNIVIDMKTPQTFNQIAVESTMDPFDTYSLYVSDDGQTWGNPILSGSTISGLRVINFPPQQKRYIKYENKMSVSRWWGFWNFCVFNTETATKTDTGDNVNIALNKPTTGSNIPSANLLVDGDTTTGSTAPQGAGSNLTIDLGATYQIGRMHVRENSGMNDFFATILTSLDGTTWTAQQDVNMAGSFNTTRLRDIIIYGNYSARYIKIDAPNINYGSYWSFPKFYEVAVYKSGMPSTGIHKTKNTIKNGALEKTITRQYRLNGKRVNLNARPAQRWVH